MEEEHLHLIRHCILGCHAILNKLEIRGTLSLINDHLHLLSKISQIGPTVVKIWYAFQQYLGSSMIFSRPPSSYQILSKCLLTINPTRSHKRCDPH